MYCYTPALLALVASLAPSVSAHGFVSGIVAGGKWYPGGNPSNRYTNPPPKVAGWAADNLDNGFVPPSMYSSENITCHKAGTPGKAFVPVKAGSTVELQWTAWPSSHHGPVIDMLARCPGDCTEVDKSTLRFFKVDAKGLESDSIVPGTWASDKLIANNNSWTMTIPAKLAPGGYVLRHEIIALHSAENADGAQNYPQCINLQVESSGKTHPCDSGADCVHGPQLYNENAPGILVNIYQTLSSYTIPGPAKWSGFSTKLRRAMSFIA